MSLSQAWRIVLLSALGFLLFGYAVFSRDFLPSRLCLRGALIGGVLLAVWAGFASRKLPQAKRGKTVDPRLRAACSALLGGLFGFYIPMNVGGQVYTYMAGAPVSGIIAVSGWHPRGGRTCGGPELAGYPWSQELCVPSEWRQRLPVGTRLHMRGIVSPLGLAIRSLALPSGESLPI